ncbi:MAG: CvpA family protein [Fibrobacterota bacterium]
MNWIDISLLLIVSLSIYLGLRKGFLSSLFSVFYIAVGFYAAGYACHRFSTMLGHNPIIRWAAFVFCFLLAFWILTYLGRFLKFLGGIVISKAADVVGGVLLGILRGLLVAVFLLFCAILLNFDKSDVINRSLLAPKIISVIQGVVAVPPSKLKDHIGQQFDGIRDAGKSILK